ncbi:PAAR domain-containing protein [Paraburkholderia sediminicola]|uniref:PAAR domain-containing protein n=1 Tax=Paraburkholderia sediminicola TaxID=458836 RepID=UPI0038BC79CF
MRKAAVRDGDPTTTGGCVLGSSTGYTDHGKKLALDGDVATCGNCKGIHRIFGTGRGMSDKGRNVVVDGDSVSCPCGKNRVIVANNSGYFLNSDQGAAAASNASSATQSVIATGASVVTYDEQVRATALGVVLKGYPYFIETADGRAHAGRIDASGQLPRTYTDSTDDYTVHWGDEALEKRLGV